MPTAKPLSRAQAEARLKRVRKLAFEMPETSEAISHGAPVWWVGGKRTFLWFSDNHHGSGITGIIVKLSGAEEHRMLIEADPALFYKNAYFRPEWIGMNLNAAPDWDHVRDRIVASWRHAAPPAIRKRHPEM